MGSLRFPSTLTISMIALACGNSQMDSRFHPGIRGESPLSTLSVSSAFTVSSRYPGVGDNWGDYVRLATPTVACDGTESGSYSTCIHGGEYREVVLPTSYTSCANLTLTDALSAFQWTCSLASGQVVFRSTGFQAGKGLKDLIAPAGNAWLANSVTLSVSGVPTLTSASTSWWSNPVTPLPSSASSTVTLSSAGTLYVGISNQNSQGYQIGADKISIAILSGYSLTGSALASDNCNDSTGTATAPNARCLIAAGSRKFLWIEGSFNGGSVMNRGILLASTKFSRLEQVTLSGILGVPSPAATGSAGANGADGVQGSPGAAGAPPGSSNMGGAGGNGAAGVSGSIGAPGSDGATSIGIRLSGSPSNFLSQIVLNGITGGQGGDGGGGGTGGNGGAGGTGGAGATPSGCGGDGGIGNNAGAGGDGGNGGNGGSSYGIQLIGGSDNNTLSTVLFQSITGGNGGNGGRSGDGGFGGDGGMRGTSLGGGFCAALTQQNQGGLGGNEGFNPGNGGFGGAATTLSISGSSGTSSTGLSTGSVTAGSPGTGGSLGNTGGDGCSFGIC